MRKHWNLAFGRWDLEKGLGSQQQYDVAVRICGQIARFMIEKPPIGDRGVMEIEARVSEYLSERNLEIDGQDLLDRLFSRSGVLIKDESNLTACFKHRSFAEFFCAAEWLHTNSFSVDVRALDPYWATIYFFSVGQLSDCEDTLKAILALKPLDTDQRINKVFAAPGYLLAGHMTPYRIVEKSLPGLFIEAASVYVDMREKSRFTP